MTRTRITTDGLTDASVTTSKVADAAITDAKIAAVAAAKVTGQIATAQVADGAITDAKITTAGLAASSINWQAIAPWAANTSYAKGALVEFQGIAYRRSVAGTSGATFNTANWQQITATTIPNTIVTGLGTMSTATATDYLARAGGTMTGQLVTTAGSALAPGVAVGTSNNGIIQPTTNAIGVATNGTERWRVGSDGSITSVIPGGSALLPQFQCRAWVNFDGTRDSTGAASTANTNRFIRGSGNVASVLRNGTGDYTITFTMAMPDGNYSVTALCGSVGVAAGYVADVGGTGGAASNHTASAARLVGYQPNGTVADFTSVNASIFR